ncbi:MAG: hypothetical protein EPN91_02260 [Salinibacterium sp.]|nr:MAG: hypothetical protein EPN91_02260 [Salinibacterium sp.]
MRAPVKRSNVILWSASPYTRPVPVHSPDPASALTLAPVDVASATRDGDDAGATREDDEAIGTSALDFDF